MILLIVYKGIDLIFRIYDVKYTTLGGISTLCFGGMLKLNTTLKTYDLAAYVGDLQVGKH